MKIYQTGNVSASRRGQSCLHLALCYLQGFGTTYNSREGLTMLKSAADLGDNRAQAIYYRICCAIGENMHDVDDPEAWLITGTHSGSVVAAQELRKFSPTAHNAAVRTFRTQFCGVGQTLFDHDRIHTLSPVNNFGDQGQHRHTSDYDLPLNSRGDLFIHYAAMCGWLGTVQTLLDEHPSYLDAVNNNNETPFFCACRSGHFDVCRELIKRGAKMNDQNMEREMPLHWLISFDDHNIDLIAEQLVSRHREMLWAVCDTNQTCYLHVNHGLVEGTPLHRAVASNNAKATKALLDLGADPLHGSGPIRHFLNFGPSKTTPLILAIMMHSAEIIGMILDNLKQKVHELNPTSKEMKDRQNEDLNMGDLKALMRFGGAYETLVLHRTHSLLYFAVYAETAVSRMLMHGSSWLEKKSRTLDLLRRKGINEEVVSAAGTSIIFSAVERGESDIVDSLLADSSLTGLIDRSASEREIRPIHVSILAGNIRVFNLLLRHNVDVLSPFEEEDGTIWTALHACAMSSGHGVEFAKRLLGLHSFLRYTQGSEPVFSTAVAHRSFELATFMKNNGASPDQLTFPPEKGTRGFTTLGRILLQNLNFSLPAVQYLLENPENLQTDFIVEPKGRSSAFHFAIYINQPSEDADFEREFGQLFEYLLRKFPNNNHVNHADEYGLTALHFAIIAGNDIAVKLLLAAGSNPNQITDFFSSAVGISPLDLALLYQSTSIPHTTQARGDLDAEQWKRKADQIVDMIKAGGGGRSKAARAKMHASKDRRTRILARVIELDRRWLPVRKLCRWERAFWKTQRERNEPGYKFISARGIEL